MHRQIAGRLTGRHSKWVVVVSWLIIGFAIGGGFAAKLSSVQDNQASSWLPGSAESTKALAKMSAFQSPNLIPTVVVYERDSGLTPADFAAAKSETTKLAQLPGATGKVIGPIPSPDHKVIESIVSFNFGKDGWNKMPDAVKGIHKIVDGAGLKIYVAGPGGQAADSAAAFSGLDSTLLFATVGVVVLILLITYRSPILWLLPVMSAGIALGTAQGVVYLLAKHLGLTVNGQSQGILTVLVFGAGTDYALLLVARYREELRRHEDRHEAMAFALHRAAPAVLASGTTVILGMLCLLFAEMNSTRGMGPVLAIGIAVALAVMLTLLPALLVIFGRWVFWPARPSYGSAEPTAQGVWARTGRRIATHPRRVWVVTALILGSCCIGVVQLNAHGLSTKESYTKDYPSVVGQQVLTDHGLADESSPVQVVATASTANAVRTAMTGIRGVDPPGPPSVKGDIAVISAPLKGDASSPAAADAVLRVRAAVHAVPGADALVGGTTAINRDVETASSRDNKVIIPIVLLVVLLILMLLLRALVAPLVLIATVVLSYGAALGISAQVFRHVFGFAGADSAFPLFVFVFLVALGIDYNIFLMTRVREETATKGTRQGALIALGATGGVITSAGVVLAATFLVLGTLPLVAFAEIGMAVAIGVLLDTLVVRSVLVTALNLELGSKMWWPSALDRATTQSPEIAIPERVL